jgi:hypothetical protein
MQEEDFISNLTRANKDIKEITTATE